MSDQIVQINFKYDVATAEYAGLCASIADAFAAAPGLTWKIWLLNEAEKEAGGIYLFNTTEAAQNFLSGPLVAQVAASPALHDVSAKTFGVMADVTAITRGPVSRPVAAAA